MAQVFTPHSRRLPQAFGLRRAVAADSINRIALA
jgi:hypothetical protein